MKVVIDTYSHFNSSRNLIFGWYSICQKVSQTFFFHQVFTQFWKIYGWCWLNFWLQALTSWIYSTTRASVCRNAPIHAFPVDRFNSLLTLPYSSLLSDRNWEEYSNWHLIYECEFFCKTLVKEKRNSQRTLVVSIYNITFILYFIYLVTLLL